MVYYFTKHVLELNAVHSRLEDFASFFGCMKGFYLEDEFGSDTFDKKTVYKNIDILAKILSWVNYMDSCSSNASYHYNFVTMTSNASVQLVESLYLGIQHYPNSDNLNEILLKFLTNFKPSPKCMYGSGCGSIAEQGFDFCNDHRCYFSFGIGHDCLSAIADGKSYCNEHVCLEDDCDQARLSQMYCYSHSCYVCLDLGVVSELASGEPPRNTCEKHLLCISNDAYGMLCQNLAVKGESFCLEHEPIRCTGLTKRGKIVRF
jgi:hypothetical protein